jgi:hypothetical protein
MEDGIIIVILRKASGSCFSSFITGFLTFIVLLGGFLFSFEWLATLIQSYFAYPYFLLLFLLSAVIYIISYFAFRKKKTYLNVMSIIAFFTIIIVFVGNSLLGFYSGTSGMRSNDFENLLLWVGYVFCCIFIGTALPAIICLISHLIVKKRKTSTKLTP